MCRSKAKEKALKFQRVVRRHGSFLTRNFGPTGSIICNPPLKPLRTAGMTGYACSPRTSLAGIPSAPHRAASTSPHRHQHDRPWFDPLRAYCSLCRLSADAFGVFLDQHHCQRLGPATARSRRRACSSRRPRPQTRRPRSSEGLVATKPTPERWQRRHVEGAHVRNEVGGVEAFVAAEGEVLLRSGTLRL